MNEPKCKHLNIEIIEPCCTTPDSDTGMISCDCGGRIKVNCPDCNNMDLTSSEVDEVLNGYVMLGRAEALENERDNDV